MFTELAIPRSSGLLYGTAPKPVSCGFDLTIGDGTVYPEVNFTLPAIAVEAETWPAIVGQYEQIANDVVRRGLALQVPGIVLEFELLPAMTEHPEWGAELTAIIHRRLQQAHEERGLRCALRVTPTDIRDQEKPPVLREGAAWENVRRSFELCIEAGADIVSIESVGGKEVHDEGLMYGDTQAIVFALGILAPRDMAWLWAEISNLCKADGRAVPGGDTACGFANTAMQLAHQKMLPEVLAAVVRAMSAVRSLVAFENGAVGPSKDCAYEGPVIKAVTGRPISMEGKSASCAHFSPMGNIAAAMCDLWSNESVQNVPAAIRSSARSFYGAARLRLPPHECRGPQRRRRIISKLVDRIRPMDKPASGSPVARGNHKDCRRDRCRERLLPSHNSRRQSRRPDTAERYRRGASATFGERAKMARPRRARPE